MDPSHWWQRTLICIGQVLFLTSLVYAGEVWVPIGPNGSGLSVREEVKSITELREEGLVMQGFDYSCGSAALASILNAYLGIPCTEMDVITGILNTSDTKVIASQRGFSLLDLRKYAESRGVTGMGYRLDMDLLRKMSGTPVLAPIFIKEQRMRHFVVVLGIKDDRVYLADPSLGRHWLTCDDFAAQWDLKIGMIFSKPGAATPIDSPLMMQPEDETTLATSTVLSIALQPTVPYIHIAKEF